ncbi:hypothetical protein [Ghiorsea bivora]|uniref:hypothetical protein n=1 Tax=Ghiorsea bivora TaxID=1485545 RepID=UPI000571B8FF|nr:hypothetical protein [Ghiorsea bivora]
MRKQKVKILAVITMIGFVGCSSGGDSPPQAVPIATSPVTSSTLVSGVVATGAPLVGFVAVKGSAGNVATANIDAQGKYSVDTSNLTLPLVLYASGISGGKAYSIISAATISDVGNTVNITPLTDLIVSNVAGSHSEAFFNNPNYTLLSANNLTAAKDVLALRLEPMLTAAGLGAGFDLMNAAFNADHTGYDALLDLLDVQVDTTTNQATITYALDSAITITDDLTTTADATPIGAVNTGVFQANGAIIQEINAFMLSMNALFANGTPAAATVSPFFTAGFLHQGTDNAAAVTLFSSTLPAHQSLTANIIATFGAFSIVSIDTTVNPQLATIRSSDSKLMNLEKSVAAGWQLAGDGHVWGAEAAPESHLDQATGTVINNFLLSVDDASGVAILPNDYFIITGPGVNANGGVIVQYDFNNFNNAVGKTALMWSIDVTDVTALTFPDGADYTVTRYRDVNGDTNIVAGVNQVNVNDASTLIVGLVDTLIDSQVVRLVKRPIKPSETTSYITITNPTTVGFLGFTSGTINAAWTLPVGSRSGTVDLSEFDSAAGSFVWLVENEVADTATSFSFLAPAPTNITSKPGLYVFGYDVFNRVTATHINSY